MYISKREKVVLQTFPKGKSDIGVFPKWKNKLDI
jgi:hypothetical protein